MELRGEMEYLRECGVNYLRCPMLEPPDYRLQMLLRNQPGCFLPAELRRIDDCEWLYCRISGLISLRQRLERDRLGEQDLLGFFESVERLCRSMEEYLLPFEGVMLNPDYIYVRPDSLRECYWFYGDRPGDMTAEAFLEYLLDRVNYEDQRAVKLMYAVYQSGRNCDGGVEMLREASRREIGPVQERTSVGDRATSYRQPSMPGPEIPAHRTDGGSGDGHVPEQLPVKKRENFREEWAEKKRRKSIWESLTAWLRGLGKDRHVTVKAAEPGWREQRWEPKAEMPMETSPGTTLLTGGMTDGGIYCLRSRSVAYPDLLLTSYPYFIGKDENRMDGVVEDVFVSRYHARIDREEGVLRVMDLGSTNGTFLNKERLQPYESKPLREGDILVFAHREYEFCFLR